MIRMRALLCISLAVLNACALCDQARIEVVADTSLQGHSSELTLNSGASSAIRIKGNEHFMLIKLDLASVREWRIDGARLFLRAVRPHMLRTLGLSTISADWQEGAGTSSQVDGGCTFTHAVWPDQYWAGPGSTFTDVSLTNGKTRSFYADVREEGNGWLSVEVDPWLVYAMASGASHGLCVSDEKGQTRANNDVYSREQNNSRPYLLVDGAPGVLAQTPVLTGLRAEAYPRAATFDAGAIRLALESDHAFHFRGTYRGEGDASATAIPHALIPYADEPAPSILIDDLAPGAQYTVELWPVDRARNRGRARQVMVRASAAKPLPRHLARTARERDAGSDPPSQDGLTVWACPAECKVSPVSGNVLEEVGAGRYEGEAAGTWPRSNPVWNGRQVSLSAARGETIAVKLVVESDRERQVQVTWDRAGLSGPNALARNWYVKDGAWFEEYMIPLSEAGAQVPAADNAVPGQRNQAFTLICGVALDAEAGPHAGVVTITSGGTEIRVPLQIRVRDVSLPADTTFEVDLNCYGPVCSDADFAEYLQREREYYRAAHGLRATINPLPYSQSGKTYRGFVPELEGAGADIKVADWSEYDLHYGPYLDGSAFEGIRAGVPITHMYLPHHESWPLPIERHYSAGNDIRRYIDNIIEHALTAPAIELAFSRDYQDAFVAVTQQFVEHFRERDWSRTDMQCYQNNKYYFKDEEHGFRGTSWWLLDEPMHRDDFLALGFFADLFRQGAGGNPRFVYRGDISRPQWQRNWLDALMDVACVSSALFDEQRHCRRMRDQWGLEFWHYGTANPVRASNLSGEAWALKAYAGGADGILPWNCIGGEDALTRPTDTALFIPGQRFGVRGPVVSLRMLGLCRGQQDVEYLNLLAGRMGYDREQTGRLVADFLQLGGEHRQAYSEDAGTVAFDRLAWEDFAQLREAVEGALVEG